MLPADPTNAAISSILLSQGVVIANAAVNSNIPAPQMKYVRHRSGLLKNGSEKLIDIIMDIWVRPREKKNC